MKKGYVEFGLLVLFVYIGWGDQLVMARHHHHLHHRQCSCPAGYGSSLPCGSRRHHLRSTNVTCAPCEPDHYSPANVRACLPCSRCGPGLYVAHPCTSHSDTVCDSCHTYRGPHNRDFRQRCFLDGTVRRPVSDDSSEEGSPSPYLQAVVGVTSCLVVFLAAAVAACLANRFCCRRTNPYGHAYEAVATKEAVLL